MDMAGINTEMRKLHNYHMISTKAKSYRSSTDRHNYEANANTYI